VPARLGSPCREYELATWSGTVLKAALRVMARLVSRYREYQIDTCCSGAIQNAALARLVSQCGDYELARCSGAILWGLLTG
jgi:hypothetical protein